MPETGSAPTREQLLGTRGALVADPLNIAVIEWLRPVYLGPVGSTRGTATTAIKQVPSVLGEMAAALKSQSSANGSIGTALKSVTAYISSPASTHYTAAFEQVKRQDSSALKTFVSVVYARAMLIMLSSNMK